MRDKAMFRPAGRPTNELRFRVLASNGHLRRRFAPTSTAVIGGSWPLHAFLITVMRLRSIDHTRQADESCRWIAQPAFRRRSLSPCAFADRTEIAGKRLPATAKLEGACVLGRMCSPPSANDLLNVQQKCAKHQVMLAARATCRSGEQLSQSMMRLPASQPRDRDICRLNRSFARLRATNFAVASSSRSPP
jgi:hypothetical protein